MLTELLVVLWLNWMPKPSSTGTKSPKGTETVNSAPLSRPPLPLAGCV